MIADASADAPLEPERRRRERRINARVADLTIPEMRRLLVTTLLSSIVVVLFLYMVRRVIVAGVLGVIIASYIRPLYVRILRASGTRSLAALLTIGAVIVPVLAALAYSYAELSDLASYVDVHRDELATQVTDAVHRLPFFETADVGASVRAWVLATSGYGARIPGLLRKALVGFSIAATVFLFTAFYILVDGENLAAWIRRTIPPRYAELRSALETSVRGVLYGAIYSTLVTQTLKSVVILLLNLLFGVPLAAVLAILSFIIGFFPIVGSWSVYVPVALWLLVFRGATVPAIVMLLVGFLGNTLFISMYLRPKLAADRSRVLNFYWMLVALVTGVYTFGLAGILIGPILIGMLKAIIDTVSATTGWRVLDESDADDAATGSERVIRFTDVTKEYPRTGVALTDVNLQVGKGEFVFLTGPSGSGKSTILKLIYMEELPTAGEVRVSGLSTTAVRRSDVARLRRKLGIVFQDFRLLEDRTIERNVAFALEVTGAPRANIPSRVSRLLTQVGLASKATAYPRELSGGEQQRVAIARALVNEPYVLIADEPTGNLDDRATRGIFQLLREINASGTAVVMATHNLELIRRSDYRTVEINRGAIVFDSGDNKAPVSEELV